MCVHSRRRWWRSRRGPVGCAALAGRRERSGSRPCRDGCRPRCQRDRQSAPPPAARLDLIEPSSAAPEPQLIPPHWRLWAPPTTRRPGLRGFRLGSTSEHRADLASHHAFATRSGCNRCGDGTERSVRTTDVRPLWPPSASDKGTH
jgi:hypothetical protein